MNRIHIPEDRLKHQSASTAAFLQQLIDLNALRLSHDGRHHYCSSTGAVVTGTKRVYDREKRSYIYSLKFEYRYPG